MQLAHARLASLWLASGLLGMRPVSGGNGPQPVKWQAASGDVAWGHFFLSNYQGAFQSDPRTGDPAADDASSKTAGSPVAASARSETNADDESTSSSSSDDGNDLSEQVSAAAPRYDVLGCAVSGRYWSGKTSPHLMWQRRFPVRVGSAWMTSGDMADQREQRVDPGVALPEIGHSYLMLLEITRMRAASFKCGWAFPGFVEQGIVSAEDAEFVAFGSVPPVRLSSKETSVFLATPRAHQACAEVNESDGRRSKMNTAQKRPRCSSSEPTVLPSEPSYSTDESGAMVPTLFGCDGPGAERSTILFRQVRDELQDATHYDVLSVPDEVPLAAIFKMSLSHQPYCTAQETLPKPKMRAYRLRASTTRRR